MFPKNQTLKHLQIKLIFPQSQKIKYVVKIEEKNKSSILILESWTWNIFHSKFIFSYIHNFVHIFSVLLR